ncbi:hypothetical protein CDD80_3951 [Ophiocordyceps camponoti-rufipedis]|uniref:Nephrocystin 3-like N-terminal domain-containing protein n=1 Tax=Ophiocordyceps camponoti-rufipedis TaxID=2004952 RepID=A0A2C5XI43_9HYPO|nr:hypothetical protein CDD80_3951 [Ophiocordyceps camponoti-rufipedis]
MASHASDWTRVVFRLTKIPSSVTTYNELAAVLARALGSIPASSITVYSLATTLSFWDPTPNQNEWQISVTLTDGTHVLVLDNHFWGLTPLNDVQDDVHSSDCIAITGLAGHAFGSWQPRGGDKSFMWIRDLVPDAITGMRTIVYGYESKLLGSNSFQGIEDLALSLISQMTANDINKSEMPLVFLAHSLGGIVLKSALCRLANAEKSVKERQIFTRLRGAIMFGVPNLGMEQNHLLTLVGDRPVKHLIRDLSMQSGRTGYLDKLERSFSGIAALERIRIMWAYETIESPTVDATTNKMTGTKAVLVDPGSATGHRVEDRRSEAMVMAIPGDHSTIVKYSRSDSRVGPVIDEMRTCCGLQSQVHDAQQRPAASLGAPVLNKVDEDKAQGATKLGKWIKALVESLDCPELNLRREQISDRFKHTFEWIFDYQPFVSWLSADEGMFWIKGKPGSGKSTMMKFICLDQRIREYGHDFSRIKSEITVTFFFNYRGTPLQKSLPGLLQNVLRQVLEQLVSFDKAEPILELLLTKLPAAMQESISWTRQRMEEALRIVLNQDRAHLSVTFFIDALDEYDGLPENVVRFLKYLIERPSESLTKTRVCFSSRPWDVFKSSFDGAPGLTVEDFTRQDIHDYCTSALALGLGNGALIRPLVDKITGRASGVFLWVSLVTREILKEFSHGQAPSVEALLDLINELPDELGNYYDYIIRRIPGNERWRTYALLEALVRTRSSLDYGLVHLHQTTLMSHCRTIAECHEALRQANYHRVGRYSDEVKTRATRDITLWSGGLVSLNGNHLELMHQTVYEFVVNFIDSLSLLEVAMLGEIFWYIEDDGMKEKLQYVKLTSHIGLAVHLRLRLYIDEHLDGDSGSSVLANCPDPLLQLIAFRNNFESQFNMDESPLEMANFIISRGYALSREPFLLYRLHAFWTYYIFRLKDTMRSHDAKQSEEADEAAWEAAKGAAIGAAKWAAGAAFLGAMAYVWSPVYRATTIQFKVYLHMSGAVFGGMVEADSRLRLYENQVRAQRRWLREQSRWDRYLEEHSEKKGK